MTSTCVTVVYSHRVFECELISEFDVSVAVGVVHEQQTALESSQQAAASVTPAVTVVTEWSEGQGRVSASP